MHADRVARKSDRDANIVEDTRQQIIEGVELEKYANHMPNIEWARKTVEYSGEKNLKFD